MNRFSITVLRNSAFGALAQVAIKLLSFTFSILIVRRLGVEDYGQYAAILAFGAVFVFVSDLGLSPYSVRVIARLRDESGGMAQIQSVYADIALLRFLLSLLTACLIVLTAWLTKRPPVMILAVALNTLGLMMYSFYGASDAVLAGFERLDLSAATRVINQAVFVGLGATALAWSSGYFGLIAANLVAIAIMTYLGWRYVRRLGVRLSSIDPARWPRLLRASLPFGIIGLTLGLSYKFDSVLLNIYWGDVATGYYNAAYNLVFSAVVLSNVVTAALYPSLARQSVSQPETLGPIYARALRYALGLSLPIAVGVMVLADPLVAFLFGAEYAAAVNALRIVIWAVPLMFLADLYGYMIVVEGQEARVARSVMVSTGVNVLANLALVPRYGFMAAAVMTVVTELILVTQYTWLLRSHLRSLDWNEILMRPLVASAVMGVLVFGLRHAPVLVAVLSGMAAYGLMGLVVGVLGKDELEFVRAWRDQRRHGVYP